MLYAASTVFFASSAAVPAPWISSLTAASPNASLRLCRARLAPGNGAGGNEYCLATTLLDQNQFPVAALSDAYHGRWGIEELYKVSKRLMEIEQFHAKSERGVKQELYAHFVLVTVARTLKR